MATLNTFTSIAILHKMRVYYAGLTGLTGITTDTPGVANASFSNPHCVIIDAPSGKGGSAANILINVNASDFSAMSENEHMTMLFGAFGQAVAHQIFTSQDGFAEVSPTVPEARRGVFGQILALLDEGYAQSHIDEAIGGALLASEYEYANYIYDKHKISDFSEDKNQFYEALRQFGLTGRLNSDFKNLDLQKYFIDQMPAISAAMLIQNEAERAHTAAKIAQDLDEKFHIQEGLSTSTTPVYGPGKEKTGSDKAKGVTVTNRQAVLDQLEMMKQMQEEGLLDEENMAPKDGNQGSQLISHDKEVNDKMRELGMTADSDEIQNVESSGVTILEDDRQDDVLEDNMLDEISSAAGADDEVSTMMPEDDSDLDNMDLEIDGFDDPLTDGASNLDDLSANSKDQAGNNGGQGQEIDEQNGFENSGSTDNAGSSPNGRNNEGFDNNANDDTAGHDIGNVSDTAGMHGHGAPDASNSDLTDDAPQSDNNEDTLQSERGDLTTSASGDRNSLGGPDRKSGGFVPSLSDMADDLDLKPNLPDENMLSLTSALTQEISKDAEAAAAAEASQHKLETAALDNFQDLGCTDLHGLDPVYSKWLANGSLPAINNVVLNYIKEREQAGYCIDVPNNRANSRGPIGTRSIKPDELSAQYQAMVQLLSPQISYLATSIEKMLIKERNAHSYGKRGKLSLKKQMNKPNSLRPFVKHNNTENEYNTCVTCLVDLSGSMCGGDKSAQATIGSIILAEACARLDIPCKITGFHASGRRPDHEHFTSWNNSLPERETLLAIPSLTTGNNYDAFAITTIAEDALKTAPADHNLIFVLSDGSPCTISSLDQGETLPNGQYIAGDEKEVRRIVRALKRKARVYGIGIEHDVSLIYENTTINIKDASQIGVTLGSYLQVALRDFIREDLS